VRWRTAEKLPPVLRTVKIGEKPVASLLKLKAYGK